MFHGPAEIDLLQNLFGGHPRGQMHEIAPDKNAPCHALHHSDDALVQWLHNGSAIGWEEHQFDVTELVTLGKEEDNFIYSKGTMTIPDAMYTYLVRDMVVQEQHDFPPLFCQLSIPLLQNFSKGVAGHPATFVPIIITRESHESS